MAVLVVVVYYHVQVEHDAKRAGSAFVEYIHGMVEVLPWIRQGATLYISIVGANQIAESRKRGEEPS